MVARTHLVDERFALLRLLGSGGFAEVWLADDLEEHRHVALKLPRGRRSQLVGEAPTPDREFDVATRLDHPNIVRVLASGTSDGEPYLVLEYVEGTSLRERLADAGPLTIPETRTLAADLCSALGHAHGRGVLHNDIKPENILLSPDGAKLTDFGAAAGVLSTFSLGPSTDLAATIAYLAPEVLQGERPTPQSDIYALGLVLYEAVAGRLPWASGTATAVAGQRLAAPAAPLNSFVPEAPESLVTALSRAIAMTPEERFASAEEFALAVQGIQQTVRIVREPAAVAVAVPIRDSRASRGGKTALAAAAVSAPVVKQTTRAKRATHAKPVTVPGRRRSLPAWLPTAAMLGGGLAAVIGLGSILDTSSSGFGFPRAGTPAATPDVRLVASEPTPTATAVPTEIPPTAVPTARPTRIFVIPILPGSGNGNDGDSNGRGSERDKDKDDKDDDD